ncbi:galacturonosyltransferase [Pelagirhabdus alkalitolerans]|uniref:Galacturonosyltransferase n=1 Tax=Pelagirhabdus alkalitolerans TaxID=1612202 RepID=A0A1G6GH63_9BACI|nr:glycosyltransferase family 4 protein [Pelagirhabdus alkalitolerans]SDB81095.1 galacturonosyltransferase [Pelagirhabdus alkalitolerans]
MGKTILILVNHDIVIYNFRKEIVEELIQQGHNVIISSPYGERIDDLIAMGSDYVETDMRRHSTNIFGELKLIREYKRMMKSIQPDVVLTFTIKPNIYGGIAAQSQGIPYIANITGLGTAVENGGVMQRITTLLYRYAFRNVNTVFFQNEENKQFFVDRNIAIKKHHVLPGSGVNLEHFKPLPYPDGETVEFAFISRIMKQKGIDQYLEAAKVIKKKYPNTIFHVCGFCEEEYEGELNQLHQDGIIHYHGMIRDIREVLKSVHCTVHPTYYPEGLSNVLLESAACARPIITTDRSGCREAVEDGINGYLVKPKDTTSLIEKIEQFLCAVSSEKKSMGNSGREKVSREFDRKIVVEQYLKRIN